MLNKRADKLELLRIAEAVASEKSIDKELIINSMETGIAKAAKSKFGAENEIKVKIDRSNGDINIYRVLKIVEKTENLNTEISLEDAQKLNNKNGEKKISDIFIHVKNHNTAFIQEAHMSIMHCICEILETELDK